MLVNIIETFDEGGRRWFAGDNPDVAREVGARWVADGKATADADGVQDQRLTAAQVQAVQFTDIAAADIASTAGSAIGESRQISDGTDRGARLIWAVPDGATEPAWCWWLWPQSAYEGA